MKGEARVLLLVPVKLGAARGSGLEKVLHKDTKSHSSFRIPGRDERAPTRVSVMQGKLN